MVPNARTRRVLHLGAATLHPGHPRGPLGGAEFAHRQRQDAGGFPGDHRLAGASPSAEAGAHPCHLHLAVAVTDLRHSEESERVPLQEMGLEAAIRVGLRTGDTSAKERAQIRQRPPHILLNHAREPGDPALPTSVPRRPGRVPVRHPGRTARPGGKQARHAPERVARTPGAAAAAGRGSAVPLCRIGLSATISPLANDGRVPGRGGAAPACWPRRAWSGGWSWRCSRPCGADPYPPAGLSAGRVLRELAALVRSRRSVMVFTKTRAGRGGFRGCV